MRVAYLDMTNSSQQCPSGLRQRTDSNRRTCARAVESIGCSFVNNFIMDYNIEYSKVCGQIIGYQYGEPEAFNRGFSIDTNYVAGVSLTHGNPREHIWTFAMSRSEVSNSYICPCINSGATSPSLPPAFVGNDYFCDTGSEGAAQLQFYGADPLWDGAGCGPQNTCCSFNTPPWFYRQLLQPTTDAIEMRVCTNGSNNEDIAIQTIEIYAQ